MIDEFIKTIKANLYERSTSPIAGAFIISWCSWNYRILIYLFSDESPKAKIDAIQNLTNIKVGLFYPLLVAAFFIFVYPYPARFTYWFWRKQKTAMRVIRQKIESEELLSREESRDIKRQMDNLQTEQNKVIERKDTEITDLKKIIEAKISDHATEMERKDKETEELIKSVKQNNKTNIPQLHKGETNFEHILAQSLGYDALALYTLLKFSELPVSERIQKLILKDIDIARYPTLKEIDNAVNKAKKAVEAYKQENPDFFKFGTDYISKSLGFTDNVFALKHGFAEKTRNAFSKYANLVKPIENEA